MRPHYNNTNQSSQVLQSTDEIRHWLSAKPKILASIYKQAADSDTPAHQAIRQAETRYQAILQKRANAIYAQYQHLPIEQKIDLLAYAQNIAEINAHIRELATSHLKAHSQAHHALEKPHHPQQQYSRPKVDTAQHGTHTAAAQITAPMSTPLVQSQPLIEIKPAKPPNDKPLVNQIGLGSPAAFTLNLPFTHIPGLPCLNQILKKIDRTTHFDLGFTAKGMADKIPNPQGGHDLVYKLSYAGFGVMSSKANVQLSPVSIKLEDSQDLGKWGGSASVFTKQHSDGLGSKYTVNINDSDASLSYAHEYSYQRPSNKIISTFTGGRYFGNDVPVVRIPARYVPTLERIGQSLPDRQEMDVILDRIDKVIPASQAYQIGASVLENTAELAKKAHTAITHHVLSQQVKQSGLEEKAQQTVMAKIHENTLIHLHRNNLQAEPANPDDGKHAKQAGMQP